MSDENGRYRVDEPTILAEDISGEVLAIDNRTGAYMSITGTGVPIWNLLAAGHTPLATADALAAHHGADAAAVRASVAAFVDRLVEARLIVAAERPEPGPIALPAADPAVPFTEPQLDVYTDMEELLLFDPIHEVTEQGWPKIDPGVNRG
jgi:hypothetical protein